MAQFFELVTRADVRGQDAVPTPPAGSQQPATSNGTGSGRRTGALGTPQIPKGSVAAAGQIEAKPDRLPNGGPSLHVNVQIHIAADTTADQIDQIFASMARHFGAPPN